MCKLSVVTPTFQRLKLLRQCIDALYRQTCEPDQFEVIVVIDGSTDRTLEYLENLDAPFQLKAYWQENSGQGSARNHGARKASGDYLLFLDDDIVGCPELVAEHARIQLDSGGAIGLGKLIIEPCVQDNWFTNSYMESWSRYYEELGTRTPDWQDLYSGNVSIPRKVFIESGGFSTDMLVAEDLELGCRLQEIGMKFIFIPAASGVHKDGKTQQELLSESQEQGKAHVKLAKRHPDALAVLSKTYHGFVTFKLFLLHLLFALKLPARFLAFLRLFISTKLLHRWRHSMQQYCFWTGVRIAMHAEGRHYWRAFVSGFPILMYHAFADKSKQSGRYIVSQKKFEQQMRWLHSNGYRVISFQELNRLRSGGELPPEKSIVLTFDDGYKDFFHVAYPVLKQYGFVATVFLVSQRVGKSNSWDSAGELSDRELLSWDAARSLSKDGLEIGAHTRTHPNLISQSCGQAREEIEGSLHDISNNLDLEPTTFAYPYGE